MHLKASHSVSFVLGTNYKCNLLKNCLWFLNLIFYKILDFIMIKHNLTFEYIINKLNSQINSYWD